MARSTDAPAAMITRRKSATNRGWRNVNVPMRYPPKLKRSGRERRGACPGNKGIPILKCAAHEGALCLKMQNLGGLKANDAVFYHQQPPRGIRTLTQGRQRHPCPALVDVLDENDLSGGAIGRQHITLNIKPCHPAAGFWVKRGGQTKQSRRQFSAICLEDHLIPTLIMSAVAGSSPT